MCCDIHGVVRLRPEVTWAQVLRLYDPVLNPTVYDYDYDDGLANRLSFDPDTHEVSYILDAMSFGSPQNHFLKHLAALAREGWASLEDGEPPQFLGPDPHQTALRYWTQQRDQAQDKINELS